MSEGESDMCGVGLECWREGRAGTNNHRGQNIITQLPWLAQLQLNLIAAPQLQLNLIAATTISMRKEQKNLPAK